MQDKQRIAELEAEVLALQSKLLEYAGLLNSAYGCESCAGRPSLTNADVSRMAFKAVFRDRPDYFKDQKS
jgi:hypothetical protein